jgi:hypothetical protein
MYYKCGIKSWDFPNYNKSQLNFIEQEKEGGKLHLNQIMEEFGALVLKPSSILCHYTMENRCISIYFTYWRRSFFYKF